jgi:hypothetical protein
MSSPGSLDNPDLGAIYKALDPIIDELERHRRWNIIFMIPVALIVAPIVGIYTTLYIFSHITITEELFLLSGILSLFIGLGGAILSLFTVYRFFDRDYRRFCKRRYNREFARILRMRYEPLGSFFVNELYPHYVLPTFSRCLTEDSLTFRHKGRQIRMQEVIFTRAGINDTHFFNPQSLTGKRGLIIRIPSRRYFKNHVLVVPQRWAASDRDRLRFIGLYHYERAPFGNPQFNDKYYVMTENPMDAHLVFDPAFIERVLAFEKKVGARFLSFSFRRDEIVVFADHPHNFLEAGHLFARPRLEYAAQIIDELRLLTSLVDALELNEFTGV